jgi:steroid delta-isomerase-like uncharacterized protein
MAGCQGQIEEAIDTKGEEYKTTVQRSVDEFWNTGTLEAIDEFFATSYVGHDPSGIHAGDLATFKMSAEAMFTAFPDLQVTIEDMVAEGDRVVKRWTARGTHDGEFMGIPATGNQIEVTGIDIYRMAGDKIEECWSNSDALGMMQQLGVIPSPE